MIISLRFLQSALNDAEIQIISAAVAFTLSIPESHVQKRIYDHTARRALAAVGGLEGGERVLAGWIDLELYLIPLNTVSHWPAMATLAVGLDSPDKKEWIKYKMATFDTTAPVLKTTFDKYLPKYVKRPELKDALPTSLIFQGSLDNYGWLYAVAIEKSDSAVLVPSQIQIYNGYNAENLEVPSSALLLSNKNTIFELTIDKLKEETAYEVYMIGASIHPGYPDLMQEGDIVFIEIDTAEDPSHLKNKQSG